MSPARALIVLLVLAGCREESSSCGHQGLAIAITRTSGPFAPGEYMIELVLDDQFSTVVCQAGDAGIDDCEVVPGPEMFPRYPINPWVFSGNDPSVALVVDFEHALCVSPEDMPQHASVTVRHAGEILVAEAWAPDYRICFKDVCGRVYGSDHELEID